MDFIDSHCHLYDPQFDQDRDTVIKKLHENRIAAAVCVGCDRETSDKSIALAQNYPHIWAVIGCHPHESKDHKSSDLIFYADQAQNLQKVVGIGEIGLDYHYLHSPKDQQKAVFRSFMELASQINFPVVIHTRDAEEDTLEIIREFKGRVIGILHSFTGSTKMAQEAVDYGYKVSFSGIITFKSAQNLRDTASALSSDAVLVETDSPYLSPVPFRGRRNEPSRVCHVAQTLANEWSLDLEDVGRITTKNSREIFSKLEF